MDLNPKDSLRLQTREGGSSNHHPSQADILWADTVQLPLWQQPAPCSPGAAEHRTATWLDACIWSNAPRSVWSADPLTAAMGTTVCVTDENLSHCVCMHVHVRGTERIHIYLCHLTTHADAVWIIDKWLCCCSNELALYFKQWDHPNAVNHCSSFSQCQYPAFSAVYLCIIYKSHV